jgi:AraC-like DNA-binding protein
MVTCSVTKSQMGPLPPRGRRSLDTKPTPPKLLLELLKELLPHGRVTIACVAAQLHISVRTLQRRLRDWDLSFKGLVDDIRRSAAIQLVLAGERTATEIGFMLGYSDQAHFTRAFKRWTGMPPRQYATHRPC